MFGLLAFTALPDDADADTALYAMTITVLGIVLLHGVGSLPVARLITGHRADRPVRDQAAARAVVSS